VLNWKANMASEVVKGIERQWQEISGGAAEILPEVKRLERAGRHWRVGTEKGDRKFDVVLSCVGFGVEDGIFSYPYWADLPLDDAKVHSKTWLISGAGDGALTDLMRLCIRNFLHDDALRKVVDAVEKTSGAATIETLRRRVRERVTGAQLFQDLDPRAIAKELDLRENPVTLNASQAELFGTT
jgi:hypothetical protein